MNFIMRIIVTSIVAFGLSYLLSGIHINNFWSAIVLAIVLAVLNAIVKPILILLTLPLTIITLGLFLFVINALIILLADNFIGGFNYCCVIFAMDCSSCSFYNLYFIIINQSKSCRIKNKAR